MDGADSPFCLTGSPPRLAHARNRLGVEQLCRCAGRARSAACGLALDEPAARRAQAPLCVPSRFSPPPCSSTDELVTWNADTALSDTSKTARNTVVYLIAPLDESPLSHTSPLASIIHQVGKSRHGTSAVNMLPCAVPMSSLTRVGPSTSSSSSAGRLARLAFSVYDQLQVPVERLRFPTPETFPSARPPPLAPLGPSVRLFAAPAVNVAPSPSSSARSVQFSLSWPPMALEVEHRHRLLHVCYSSRRLSEDSGQECLAVSTVDEKGESWKVAPRLIKIPSGAVADVQRVRLVWSFVKSLVDAVDVEWRIVLCKLGEPTGLEAKSAPPSSSFLSHASALTPAPHGSLGLAPQGVPRRRPTPFARHVHLRGARPCPRCLAAACPLCTRLVVFKRVRGRPGLGRDERRRWQDDHV